MLQNIIFYFSPPEKNNFLSGWPIYNQEYDLWNLSTKLNKWTQQPVKSLTMNYSFYNFDKMLNTPFLPQKKIIQKANIEAKEGPPGSKA